MMMICCKEWTTFMICNIQCERCCSISFAFASTTSSFFLSLPFQLSHERWFCFCIHECLLFVGNGRILFTTPLNTHKDLTVIERDKAWPDSLIRLNGTWNCTTIEFRTQTQLNEFIRFGLKQQRRWRRQPSDRNICNKCVLLIESQVFSIQHLIVHRKVGFLN